MKRVLALLFISLLALSSITVQANEIIKKEDEIIISDKLESTLKNLDEKLGVSALMNSDEVEIEREVILDLRNDPDTLKKSMLEPQLIYDEIVTYKNTVLNENKVLEPSPEYITSSVGTGIIYSDSKSRTKSYTYSGTVVTVETVLSAECEDIVGSTATAVKPTNVHYHWETSDNLFADLDGGYVESYDYVWGQSGTEYNGENGSFLHRGTKTFSLGLDVNSGGYYHSSTPSEWCLIPNTSAFYYQTTVIYHIVFYEDGDSSTYYPQTSTTSSLGWGIFGGLVY